MEVFKLGDNILALLETVLGFWNNPINLVFSLLGQSPVSFKGGGPWAVVESLQPLFVGVGSGSEESEREAEGDGEEKSKKDTGNNK